MVSPIPQSYHVACKAFIRRGDEILLARDSTSHRWDLPGGRIGMGENNMPLDMILAREIEEELGPAIRYKNLGPVALSRHRKEETDHEGVLREVFALIIGFELEYEGGEIQLSDEHSECRWFPIAEETAQLLPGGQADGFRNYLNYRGGGAREIVY